MKHYVTVSVTFTVLADGCTEANNAAFEAVMDIPLTDSIIEVSTHTDDMVTCDHDEETQNP